MNIFGDGELTTQYPVYEDLFSLYDNVSGVFNKIKVDDGAIEIDHAGHDENTHDSHITLKGNLQSHEAFFKIKNAQNAELFRITHAGHLLAPQDITAPSITNNTNAVLANQTGISTNSSANFKRRRYPDKCDKHGCSANAHENKCGRGPGHISGD